MNQYPYKDFLVELSDIPIYDSSFPDNPPSCNFFYYGEETENTPSSHHIVKLYKDRDTVCSCLLIGFNGATGIHPHSSLLLDDQLLVCCGDSLFCLQLPSLELKWKTQTDPVTCFAVYLLESDFLVHGEMMITRINRNGSILWEFGGKDIWVARGDKKAVSIRSGHIELSDFQNNTYTIDFNGNSCPP